MTSVCAPDGSDFRGVTGHGEPVVDCSANAPPLDRRVAAALVAGDQQKDTLAACDRRLQRLIDGAPSPIEIVSVQIEHTVRGQGP